MTAGRNINTKSVHWNTPQYFINTVKKVFHGSIALDPCSNQYSVVGAETEYIFPVNDGLKDSWDYPTIFVNPPYGIDKDSKTRISDWFKRTVDAYNNGSEIIMLVPVATNTGHWKKFVYNEATSICFLYDTRFKFLIDGSTSGNGAPMAVCAIYYGKNSETFDNEFKEHGAIVHVNNILVP